MARSYEYQFQSAWNLLSDYLEHHGILGMKWGIRRYQPYPTGKHGTYLGGKSKQKGVKEGGKPPLTSRRPTKSEDVFAQNVGRATKLGVENYSWTDVRAKELFGTFHGQTRDKDIVIKKGQPMYRVQGSSEIAPDKKVIYTTLDGKTHLSYLDIALGGGPGVAEDSMYGGTHSLKMEAKKDLIAPSMNKTMEVFIKTMGENYVDNSFESNSTIKNRGEDFLGKQWLDASTKGNMASLYRLYFDSLMKNETHRDAFIKNLKKEGYNAIIDEEDFDYGNKGKSLYGATATVVFDAKDIKVKDVRSVDMTDETLIKKLSAHRTGISAYYTPEEAKEAWESQRGQEWLEYLGLTDNKKK